MRKLALALLATVFVAAMALGFFNPGEVVGEVPPVASACDLTDCESNCHDTFEACYGSCLSMPIGDSILCRNQCMNEYDSCITLCENCTS